MAMRHTASFLQTFHTAQTAAERTAESQTATPADTIDTDPAALAFVKGQRYRTVAAPAGLTQVMIEIKGWAVRQGPGDLTEKQASWLISIAQERELPEGVADSLKIRLEQGLAKFVASQLITAHKDAPRKAAPAPVQTQTATAKSTEVETDGIYVDPIKGRIFKAQFNKATGSGSRLYAKQLWIDLPAGWRSENILALDLSGIEHDEIGREWRYTPGAIRSIKPEWKLTAEQADQFGALYGSCMRCGRDLTLESSIRNGMGRTCAEKSGF